MIFVFCWILKVLTKAVHMGNKTTVHITEFKSCHQVAKLEAESSKQMQGLKKHKHHFFSSIQTNKDLTRPRWYYCFSTGLAPPKESLRYFRRTHKPWARPWQHLGVSSGASLGPAKLKPAFVKPVHMHARSHLSTNSCPPRRNGLLMQKKIYLIFPCMPSAFVQKKRRISTLKVN